MFNTIKGVRDIEPQYLKIAATKAGLADEIPDIKIEVPKDTKMEIMLLILRWY